MVARGRVARLITLFGLVVLPCCVHLAAAEDEESPAAGEVAEATEAEADVAGGEEGKAEDFLNGAKELQDKLAQLQELLKSKGDSADPDLKGKLAGLQTQLQSLGVTLGIDGMDGAAGAQGGGKELTAFVGGCVTMSIRRKGLKSPSTAAALKRLAAGITKEQGKDIELVRLIGTCIQDLSDTEYELYKGGQLKSVPKAMETKAATSEGREALLAMEDSIWQELVSVAKNLVKEMNIPVDQEATGRGSGSTASNLGLFALVPLLAAGAFLTKKFLDMQNESGAKSSGKKVKKQK